MKRLLLLLVVAISLTSCSGYYDALNAYNNSPAGQEQLRRQFVLDSIRASKTQYPFQYGFGYYSTNRIVPRYYNYYRPYGQTVIVRRSGTTRSRVTRGRVAPNRRGRGRTVRPRGRRQ